MSNLGPTFRALLVQAEMNSKLLFLIASVANELGHSDASKDLIKLFQEAADKSNELVKAIEVAVNREEGESNG